MYSLHSVSNGEIVSFKVGNGNEVLRLFSTRPASPPKTVSGVDGFGQIRRISETRLELVKLRLTNDVFRPYFVRSMIVSFRHKGLAELYATGKIKLINNTFFKRLVIRLDALAAAKAPNQLTVPGFDFHPLKGHNPTRYSIHVNGPWCVTFEWEGVNATNVDFEQYH